MSKEVGDLSTPNGELSAPLPIATNAAANLVAAKPRKARSVTDKTTKYDLDTLSLSNEREKSSRLKGQKAKQNLIDAIQLQGEVNGMLNTEIKNQTPSFERLQLIKKDLAASLKHIHNLYSEFRDISGGLDKSLTQLVDKLTHDNNLLNELVDQAISDMSVRPKSTNEIAVIRNVDCLGSEKSHSVSKTSSCASSASVLRLKQSEAAAKAAELEAQLQAEVEAKKIDVELSKLQSAKKAVQLKSQIAAEKRKAAIFAQALIEEENDASGLMLRMTRHEMTQKTPQNQAVHAIPPKKTIESASLPQANRNQVTDNNEATGEKEVNSSQAIALPVQTNNAQQGNGLINLKNSQPDLHNDNNSVTSSEDEISDHNSDTGLGLSPNVNSYNMHTGPIHSGANSVTPQSKGSDISHITNGLAEAISSAFSMNRLPPPEPFIFDGDPMKYPDWIFAFDSLIGNRQCNVIEKLHYLKRYVSGKALEVVEGYFLLQSQDAYEKARGDLKRRFGDPFTVS